MCSETFLRLPEEKRKRFLDAAWAEFTRVSFADASINQIVHHAEIARGSFYQYFKDKDGLMEYLISEDWAYLLRGYHAVLREVKGDIFALQLACFDQFLLQQKDEDPVLARFMRFLRINPGLDAQKLLGAKSDCPILQEIWPDVDMSCFRSREPEFAAQVMTLSLMSLAAAVVDTAIHPEKAQEYRDMLALRLKIIRGGSVRA